MSVGLIFTANCGQIELVGFLNHAKKVESNLTVVSLLHVRDRQWANVQHARVGRIGVLPTDRVYDRVA